MIGKNVSINGLPSRKLGRRCHRSPLRQRLRQNLNLSSGLNFGVHHIPLNNRAPHPKQDQAMAASRVLAVRLPFLRAI
jgi:hypothetical protein